MPVYNMYQVARHQGSGQRHSLYKETESFTCCVPLAGLIMPAFIAIAMHQSLEQHLPALAVDIKSSCKILPGQHVADILSQISYLLFFNPSVSGDFSPHRYFQLPFHNF